MVDVAIHQSAGTTRLFVLAAGVNNYIAPAPQLDPAVTDAKSFVAAMRQEAQPLYREVDAYELYDDRATAAASVLEGLD